MILADNSSSMNAATYHLAYDSEFVYTGSFDTGATYFVAKVKTPGGFVPSDFNSGFPSSPAAFLVDSDNGEDGRYSGNYLNWSDKIA